MKHHRHKGSKGPKPHEKAAKLRIDLFGFHAVRAAWDNPARQVRALYATEGALKDFPIRSGPARPAPTVVSREELDRALPPGTVHQGLAMACAPLEDADARDLIIANDSAERTVLVMLDQVTDPHNVGAILRSACAFGAAGLIMQSRHAPPLTGVLAKAACGAVEHVPVAYETNLARAIETLQQDGYFVYGLDERGEDIAAAPVAAKAVIVLGAEGPGLRQNVKEHCDMLLRLPMTGPMPSLNVSNAAAVALYAINAKV